MKINFLVPVISFSILSAITSRCESLFMFNKRGYEVVTSSKIVEQSLCPENKYNVQNQQKKH